MPVNPANVRLADLTSEDTPVEVTEFDDGTKEFNFDVEELQSPKSLLEPDSEEHTENLVEYIDDHDLDTIAADAVARYKLDKESRADWEAAAGAGLKLLGVKLEKTSEPFEGACGAHHPLILESAVKFQARASNELFSAKGPVKTTIIGKTTPEKEKQASRVRQHMNYQIMYLMGEYFDETESLLFYLPIVGSAFKKMYFDTHKGRPVAEYVSADDLVVNSLSTNLKNAHCITHVIRRTHNDLLKDFDSEFYAEIDLQPAGGTVSLEEEGAIRVESAETMGYSTVSEDKIYTLLEQYVYLNLPGKFANEKGIAWPYIVTVELESQKVLAIRRNWSESDEKLKCRQCPFVHYKFVPGLGFYGLGYVHLLGNLQVTLTSCLRSLVDSGMFANLQAGFVDKRLRIRSSDGPLKPGQFKEVEAGGIDLDRAIKLIPFKEPSQTLFAMYQFIEARGQKFADATEQIIADSTNYGPVGTTLALLEASTKFFSGVHKRLHKAQKEEFDILANINFNTLDNEVEYDTVEDTLQISSADYDGRVDVIPVSDPNMSSQSQKLTVSQAVYTAALQNPSIHDLREVSRDYYATIGVDEEKIEKFLPAPQEPQQLDPLSDLLALQQGKPIKAFQGQDHDAHIAVKTAFLQDPASGGNPMFANRAPLVQANIQEHMLLKFQESIAGTAAESGQQGDLTEQIVAQNAQKVAQQNQKIAEMEGQSPDVARSKLAEAEYLRALNEGRRQQADFALDSAEMGLKAFELRFKTWQEENKMALAGLKEENSKAQADLKNTSALLNKILETLNSQKIADKQVEAAYAKANTPNKKDNTEKKTVD
jgi:hypothetical protein